MSDATEPADWAPARTKPEHADAPEDDFCGHCRHHMDSHVYDGVSRDVPCQECPDGTCTR
jgi:hypothetical protein